MSKTTAEKNSVIKPGELKVLSVADLLAQAELEQWDAVKLQAALLIKIAQNTE